jgi:hypothetical protein
MSLNEKDLLKKLLSKRELEIIESICESKECEKQIDKLLEQLDYV